MKKIIVSMVALLTMLSVPSAAQIKFGLKGGLNITKMSFDNSVLDAKNQTGFFIGPSVKFKVPLLGFGFDVSALYDQREADTEVLDSDGENVGKITQKSIVVPINLRYSFGLGDLAGIYLAAGPQFGFNVGDKNFWDNQLTLKSSNLSVNVGGGLRLLNHLEVGVTYNIACGKTGDWKNITDVNNIGKSDVKTNAWQISAAYYF